MLFRSRLGEAVKELRPALAALDGGEVASALDRGESIVITLSNGDHSLTSDDLELRVKSQGGFAVGREGSEVVALDLTLTDELRRRGYLRDLVRQVQDLRKNSGLDVADRIHLRLVGCDDLADGFAVVANEVLAMDVTVGPGTGAGEPLEFDDERSDARAWVEKA